MTTLPRPTTAAPAADRARDPWWDNARFVAATLIVVLHTVGSIMARHETLHAYSLGTWPFRVPLFVMLAGVFSSAGPLGSGRLRGLIQCIAVPAGIFSVLYSLEVYALGGEFQLHVTKLPWTLWFLMSLFCWRLLLPLVVQLRYPLLATSAAALGAGYVGTLGMEFSASRTVVYLPLFHLGWRIGQGALREWFTARWSLPVALCGVLASGVVGLMWHREIKGSWLSMRHVYTGDTLPLEWAWLIRLAMLAAAAALVLCMLRLTPRRKLPFVSTLGSAGFTIYLLHPLVILPFREKGFIERVNTPLEQVGLVLCAVALAAVLGSPPVRRLARPLTRPPIGRLFAPLPDTTGGPTSAAVRAPRIPAPGAPVGAPSRQGAALEAMRRRG
ncbi:MULTISPECIES: acyltransferase family protein [unclassified Streptomyces]|uniref:acyltransferase family protein n=1 Tax=unclassified Streptomyces TaxID=2593676 RepID=UPI0022B7028C|nr:MULTISPECIES: acyltransferase family protein [unclassified Streptomyces]MCZ7414694.1 acyltransferase family protein [Streptomyces sp. WMMC897]MCZ7431623.1 acyltransferase family protein [Streptomyces sp. WMMC1477]